jgi:two-component system, chemotaxis family, protein-glutamate methylesterase/glutaminase
MEKDTVNGYEMLVIGGSAGSLEVVLSMLPGLTQPLRVAVVVVLHRRSSGGASLENLFRYKTGLPVREIEDKDPIVPGTVYIAPVDYHLLVEGGGTFALDLSEKVNFSRPSIDITFESAADVYGEKLACLLLSGANADGVKGMESARDKGAFVAVQDPSTAVVPLMPQSALGLMSDIKMFKPEEIAAFVNGL